MKGYWYSIHRGKKKNILFILVKSIRNIYIYKSKGIVNINVLIFEYVERWGTKFIISNSFIVVQRW